MGKFPVLRDDMGSSCRQENVGEGVPIRRDVIVFLTDRKLLAREISRLRFAPLEMTGRRDAIVFLTDRKLSFTLNSQVVNNYGVNQCDLFFPQCL